VKRFEIGDLVYIRSNSPLYTVLSDSSSFGIIKGEAILLYVHDWETEDVIKEFWAYDVIVEGQVFKNVPEEGLKRIEENENEKNSK